VRELLALVVTVDLWASEHMLWVACAAMGPCCRA